MAHRLIHHQCTSLQILTRTPRTTFALPLPFSRLLPRANNLLIQSRQASTSEPTPSPSSAPNAILAAQRLRRPVSPHLSIYKPQITWYGSALNRITASLLSGGFYVFGAAYLVAPLFGWHLESASLAAWFGALPVLAKVGIKFGLSLPFTYHAFNGVRHLVWDMGKELSNRQVARTGFAVVGLSLVSSAVLAAL